VAIFNLNFRISRAGQRTYYDKYLSLFLALYTFIFFSVSIQFRFFSIFISVFIVKLSVASNCRTAASVRFRYTCHCGRYFSSVFYGKYRVSPVKNSKGLSVAKMACLYQNLWMLACKNENIFFSWDGQNHRLFCLCIA
jgi:hypothetical protein